ncbi:uncharacterized protein LOC123555630 [Mercenaria mercenaria]|uniref:uncharacterized protein LOC123555630 n=1 Tax=Mercenaria mercenaria TaxID=6596 RepID=UPI00234EAEDE|nr:uncharacterized protein LOC123555630 [Mercenaria mercenaria]
MTLKALIVLAVLTYTNSQLQIGQNPHPGNVKERLKTPPLPMPGFNLQAWSGRWFFQYHKAPCSWAISEKFSDYTQFTELHGNVALYHETMRNHDLCNSVTSSLRITGPGVFIGNDPVGDNWSGKVIVVDTDYKTYCITWGCTKWSAFYNTCEDPWIYIKTRQMNPHRGVLRRIEMALYKLWGISINQLTRITHGRPCSAAGKLAY